MSAKVALVTGASSGIGEAAARLLKQQGYIVYAAARRVDRMAALEAEGINVLPLDITDETSIAACVDTIASRDSQLNTLLKRTRSVSSVLSSATATSSP